MNKRCLSEKWWQFCYWMGRSKTWSLGKMEIRATMALMVVVLLFAVQDQSRAQSPDGATPTEESVADCPCGDPAELVPIAMWPTEVVDCAADPKRAALYGFSFEGGVASLASTAYGRDCPFVVDATGLNGQERPISQPQVNACSVLIVSYAQALKDAGRVAVSDFGCNLR